MQCTSGNHFAILRGAHVNMLPHSVHFCIACLLATINIMYCFLITSLLDCSRLCPQTQVKVILQLAPSINLWSQVRSSRVKISTCIWSLPGCLAENCIFFWCLRAHAVKSLNSCCPEKACYTALQFMGRCPDRVQPTGRHHGHIGRGCQTLLTQ